MQKVTAAYLCFIELLLLAFSMVLIVLCFYFCDNKPASSRHKRQVRPAQMRISRACGHTGTPAGDHSNLHVLAKNLCFIKDSSQYTACTWVQQKKTLVLFQETTLKKRKILRLKNISCYMLPQTTINS